MSHCHGVRTLDIQFSTSALYIGVLLFNTREHLKHMSLRGDNLLKTGILYLQKYRRIHRLTLYRPSSSLDGALAILQDTNPNLNLSRVAIVIVCTLCSL